jgi:hypothetical protein
MAFEPVKFLLNQTTATAEAQTVQAPAFSLTKVMAVVAPLLTAVTALATSAIKNVSFDAGQITTLIVALIAFLAITASADVLARGIATSADKRANGRLRMITFAPPLSGQLAKAGADEDVHVLAASDAAPPEFLCLLADQSVAWHPSRSVRLLQN